MTFSRIAALSLASVSTAALPIVAAAEEARQLVDINGMYASEAESALRGRGFSHESSHDSHSNGYTYSYWWDREDDNCVVVEEYAGRVMTINDADDGDCGHSGSGVGTALAIGAGAAILGALLSSKSHHRDNDEDDRGENREQFDAGYRDGLYNYPYHNNSRNDSYARGYSAGVDERQGNRRHHANRGGYHPAVSFGDLQGARAAGAMSEIERRGFEQVDNFTSGNTRYSIQWNDDTRQCLQMTIADGHIYDIRDIQTHPECR
ncbi:hypothetical protein GCM10023208_16550 [Erythrobacter westpacificensis]|uniref:PepSY domain-containing protein n=1 Tax=Erythrobacter westpacificensis TaxID=1055231 RepID=A0ABP9KE67_9SPHN